MVTVSGFCWGVLGLWGRLEVSYLGVLVLACAFTFCGCSVLHAFCESWVGSGALHSLLRAPNTNTRTNTNTNANTTYEYGYQRQGYRMTDLAAEIGVDVCMPTGIFLRTYSIS